MKPPVFSKPTETRLDLTDRDDGVPFVSDEDEINFNVMDSWAECNITAEFCDENRRTRTSFSVGENVYVLLQFKNTTDKVACMQMDHISFGRRGIQLCVAKIAISMTIND